MISIQNKPNNKNTFEASLNAAVDKKFPIIYGIPNSWFNMMEFVDKYTDEHKTKTKVLTSKPKTKPKTQKPQRIHVPYEYRPRSDPKSKSFRSAPTKPYPKPRSPKKYIRNDSPNISLIMKNLPSDPSEVCIQTLTNVFELYGKVASIYICKNGGIGFVKFSSIKGAIRAYSALHKIDYKGRIVYTEYAISKY